MGWLGNKKAQSSIKWIKLTDVAQFETIKRVSDKKLAVVFKHSTRCPVSSGALVRLERDWDLPESECETYFLDLIRYREISNQIASQFSVEHQSPQLLLIKNGVVVYHASHNAVSVADLKNSY